MKAAFGLGLRPDIWVEFEKRFNIAQVYEMYGATECPMMSINLEDKVGSVGRHGGLVKVCVVAMSFGKKCWVLFVSHKTQC